MKLIVYLDTAGEREAVHLVSTQTSVDLRRELHKAMDPNFDPFYNDLIDDLELWMFDDLDDLGG